MPSDACLQVAVHSRLGPYPGGSQDRTYSGGSGSTSGGTDGFGPAGMAVPRNGHAWYSVSGLWFKQGYGAFDPRRVAGGNADACFRTCFSGRICPDVDSQPDA